MEFMKPDWNKLTIPNAKKINAAANFRVLMKNFAAFIISQMGQFTTLHSWSSRAAVRTMVKTTEKATQVNRKRKKILLM